MQQQGETNKSKLKSSRQTSVLPPDMWRADIFIPTELYIRRLHSRTIKVNAPRSLVDDSGEGKGRKKKSFFCRLNSWRLVTGAAVMSGGGRGAGFCGGDSAFFSSLVSNEARRLSRAHQRDTSCKTGISSCFTPRHTLRRQRDCRQNCKHAVNIAVFRSVV